MSGCDFVALAAEGVRALRPYKPGKPMQELQRELGLDSIIKLASNESPLGPGPAALAAVADCARGLARYPDGNGYGLKQALAAFHRVSADTLTLGNGSNDVLELVTGIEKKYGIRFEDPDLVQEVFASVNSIAEHINAGRGA